LSLESGLLRRRVVEATVAGMPAKTETLRGTPVPG